MTVSTLLKAKHIGVKSFRTHLSRFVREQEPYVIPYDDMVEFIEILDELSNPELLKQIAEGRKAYQKGGWIPVSRLWKKLDSKVILLEIRRRTEKTYK